MDQSLKKLAPESEDKKAKEIGPTIDRCYKTYFAVNANNKDWSSADFYHAVCQTVEEINKKLGTTQFRVPETNKLKEVFKKLQQIEAAPLRKEEFQEILKDVILETESEEKKAKEIGRTIDRCYQTHFADNANKKDWSSADFYYAICQTVEEINKKLGTTQFRVPETNKLKEVYKKRIAALLRKEILEDVIHESRLGVKDLWPYIFGGPVTILWIKSWVFPKALPNEFFIPFVTSATVFLLAKLNKI